MFCLVLDQIQGRLPSLQPGSAQHTPGHFWATEQVWRTQILFSKVAVRGAGSGELRGEGALSLTLEDRVHPRNPNR